jgi:hypothetical protein
MIKRLWNNVMNGESAASGIAVISAIGLTAVTMIVGAVI